MKLACPEIQMRSDSGCGNIVDKGSGSTGVPAACVSVWLEVPDGSCPWLVCANASAQDKTAIRSANPEEKEGICSRKRPLKRVRCHIKRIKQARGLRQVKKS